MRKRFVLVLFVMGLAVSASAQILQPSPQIVNGNVGTICQQTTATKNCANWAPQSYPTLTFQIVGTFVGTLVFEGTTDGLTWFTIRVVNLSSAGGATTATAAGQFAVINNGLVGVRARASAWTSGTASITITRGTATALYSVS